MKSDHKTPQLKNIFIIMFHIHSVLWIKIFLLLCHEIQICKKYKNFSLDASTSIFPSTLHGDANKRNNIVLLNIYTKRIFSWESRLTRTFMSESRCENISIKFSMALAPCGEVCHKFLAYQRRKMWNFPSQNSVDYFICLSFKQFRPTLLIWEQLEVIPTS